ncbi:MAG: hypothetical protein R3242_10425 [Akkermansiaceae bacterium]|nr:hypothetical protein [Akkermansiaceae bacterium]
MNNISKYRLISGIRSQRPNPIVIKSKGPEKLQANEPRMTENLFKANKYDKDYAFNYIQSRWFQRRLELGETLKMTADQLKMICDEVHEMGRLRERKLNISD